MEDLTVTGEMLNSRFENRDTNSSNKNKNSKKEEFIFELSIDAEVEDDYEKILEREIESQCDFGVYVNKLEYEEKSDEELRKLDKEQIIDFTRSQIRKLKAYISSLEKEKDDLIENFRDSTSVLLERIKELEFRDKGFRPETPMIAKDLKIKPKVEIAGIKAKTNLWNQKTESAASHDDFLSSGFSKSMQRCPNCTKEFPDDSFLAHSLDCLRNKIRCKKCGEMIDEKNKKEHIAIWRSKEKILEAIDEYDAKKLLMCIDHGLVPSKIIEEESGNTVAHLVAKTGDLKLLKAIVTSQKDMNILNKLRDTPLHIAIIEKHTELAKSLIDLGAEITLRNSSDMTPLMLSCKNGMIELTEYLLKHNANLNETNILGETPLKLAQMSGHEELVIVLIQKFKANFRPGSKK